MGGRAQKNCVLSQPESYQQAEPSLVSEIEATAHTRVVDPQSYREREIRVDCHDEIRFIEWSVLSTSSCSQR